jgi:hypothetical protein
MLSRLCAAVLGLALATGCASDDSKHDGAAGSHAASGDVSCKTDERVDAFTEGMAKDGSLGELSFELVTSEPAPPAKGDNAFSVRIIDKNGEPAEVSLEVQLSMPDHGHGSPAVPEVSFDAERRTFSVAPLDLFMAGVWRVDLSAYAADDAEASLDDVSFFCIEG